MKKRWLALVLSALLSSSVFTVSFAEEISDGIAVTAEAEAAEETVEETAVEETAPEETAVLPENSEDILSDGAEAYQVGDATAPDSTINDFKNGGIYYTEENPGDDESLSSGNQVNNGVVTKYVDVYRLYNKDSHEHLFTTDRNERNVLSASPNWIYEGIAWKAPTSGKPIYRMYNPQSYEHHYTGDANEIRHLIASGWKNEGIVFYSAANNGIPVYRVFNKVTNIAVGSHHFTKDSNERRVLVASGNWNDEGISWYAINY